VALGTRAAAAVRIGDQDSNEDTEEADGESYWGEDNGYLVDTMGTITLQ
jgi:hypothetical protein